MGPYTYIHTPNPVVTIRPSHAPLITLLFINKVTQKINHELLLGLIQAPARLERIIHAQRPLPTRAPRERPQGPHGQPRLDFEPRGPRVDGVEQGVPDAQ